MAINHRILYPNANGKVQWTLIKATSPAAWEQLKKAGVLQPSGTPTTTEGARGSTSLEENSAIENYAFVAGEVVIKATLYAYCKAGTGTNGFHLNLLQGSTVRATKTITSKTAEWQSCTWTRALTEKEVEEISADATVPEAGENHEVYAWYIDLETETPASSKMVMVI